MSDFLWHVDELSMKEQWAIFKKHLSHVDQVKARSASRTFFGLSASGAAIGLGLGGFITRRLRRSRLKIANMFNNPLGQKTAIGFPNGKTRMRPVSRIFLGLIADQRTEPMAYISAILQSSKIEVAATNVSIVGGATSAGACFGILLGTRVANRKIHKDVESSERIVLAWKRCRAELYRKAAEHIEKTLSDSGSVDPWQEFQMNTPFTEGAE
ncbi:MAG: hypothetical protein Q9180_006499 [Flavoplaca navasiana]